MHYTTKRDLRPLTYFTTEAQNAQTTRQRTLYTQRHSRDAGGGGLAPSAANLEPWDLVPYPENVRTTLARSEQGHQHSCAKLQNLHAKSTYRAKIEQLQPAKIADRPGY